MKRQMVNQERLPFPTGIAAATTLRSLYSEGAEAVRRAYVLIGGLVRRRFGGHPQHGERHARPARPVLREDAGCICRNSMPAAGYSHRERPAAARLRIRAERAADRRRHDHRPAGQPLDAGRRAAALSLGRSRADRAGRRARRRRRPTSSPSRWSAAARSTTCRAGRSGAAPRSWCSPALRRSRCSGGRSRGRSACCGAAGSDGGGPSELDAAPAAVEVPLGWLVAGLIPITAGLLAIQYIAFHISIWLGLIAVGMAFVPEPRGLPRHRRDRHHADRGHGQGHAAAVRRALAAGRVERARLARAQPHGRGHRRELRSVERRPADGPEERLPARGQSAEAVHRPVHRRLLRHPGRGPRVVPHGADEGEAGGVQPAGHQHVARRRRAAVRRRVRPASAQRARSRSSAAPSSASRCRCSAACCPGPRPTCPPPWASGCRGS